MPGTQGSSANTAIVIPGKDENEDEDKDKDEDREIEEGEKAEEQEEEEEGGEEEEDDGQLDTVSAPLPEEIASGILEVGLGVGCGDIPGEFGATFSRE